MTPSALTIEEQTMIWPTTKTLLAGRIVVLEAENAALKQALAEAMEILLDMERKTNEGED